VFDSTVFKLDIFDLEIMMYLLRNQIVTD